MSNVSKKALIITGVTTEIYPLFPVITKKKQEDLFILNSFGAVISQPYGCLIRSIILAIYNEQIEEIYIIREKESIECKFNDEEFLGKIKEAGVSERVINTINYIDVVNHDVIKWLEGPKEVMDVMKKNIDFIKGHPLIPSTLPVHAYIADPETGAYHSV
ncbi:Carbonic anhydrase [Bacillus sp. THAF10]|uniref:hypothetical protein n=1 Tax=Bacillus sp. THAF10 TaxID=2587848 RepID=UPI0012678AC6|nr:hypothetical protein [Bacillus sp. THAF10]QFT87618.1 Carbonic anhydrase [Bacillus sp. THAF10]